MLLEAQLFNALTEDAGVAAIVGQRVYPGRAPDQLSAPFVIMQVISADPAVTHGEASDLQHTGVQFACFAATYKEARELCAAVRAALDNVALAGGDVPIFQDERNGFDEAVEYFRFDCDFLI